MAIALLWLAPTLGVKGSRSGVIPEHWPSPGSCCLIGVCATLSVRVTDTSRTRWLPLVAPAWLGLIVALSACGGGHSKSAPPPRWVQRANAVCKLDDRRAETGAFDSAAMINGLELEFTDLARASFFKHVPTAAIDVQTAVGLLLHAGANDFGTLQKADDALLRARRAAGNSGVHCSFATVPRKNVSAAVGASPGGAPAATIATRNTALDEVTAYRSLPMPSASGVIPEHWPSRLPCHLRVCSTEVYGSAVVETPSCVVSTSNRDACGERWSAIIAWPRYSLVQVWSSPQ
jgi:hypothetical protein